MISNGISKYRKGFQKPIASLAFELFYVEPRGALGGALHDEALL
jgi:hypothetical protein